MSQIDFPELKVVLEKAGWPEPHVQAFVSLEIQRRLLPSDLTRPGELKSFEYWFTGPDAEPLAQAEALEQRTERLRRETDARAKFDALFPPVEPPVDEHLRAWEENRLWGSLPVEKRHAVSALLAGAAQAEEAFTQSRGDMLTPAEERQLDAQIRQTRTQLEKLLPPAELIEFDLRNSSTANRMRSELDNFQPTRAEFLAIFKLRHPLELEFNAKGLAHDLEQASRRQAAEARIDQAIAELLGQARYEDYRLSLDPVCQTLQFEGRHAQADAPTVRRLHLSLLAAQAALGQTGTLPEPERPAAQSKIKADLHREFRLVFDEERTRRLLQEQSLWP